METIAFINQKGGVAKTTTVAAVGAELRRRGYRVLFVDLDAQRSLSSIMRAGADGITAYEVLKGVAPATQAVQATEQGDIIAAAKGLVAENLMEKRVGREYRLKKALEPLQGAYDYCLIDCPPALSIITYNALTAATGCIIPCQADILSLEALDDLQETVADIREYSNTGLNICGVAITRYSDRAILSKDLATLIERKAAEMGTKVYNTRIREGIAIKEAQAMREDIFSYAPKSNAAADYKALTSEILEG